MNDIISEAKEKYNFNRCYDRDDGYLIIFDTSEVDISNSVIGDEVNLRYRKNPGDRKDRIDIAWGESGCTARGDYDESFIEPFDEEEIFNKLEEFLQLSAGNELLGQIMRKYGYDDVDENERWYRAVNFGAFYENSNKSGHWIKVRYRRNQISPKDSRIRVGFKKGKSAGPPEIYTDFNYPFNYEKIYSTINNYISKSELLESKFL